MQLPWACPCCCLRAVRRVSPVHRVLVRGIVIVRLGARASSSAPHCGIRRIRGLARHRASGDDGWVVERHPLVLAAVSHAPDHAPCERTGADHRCLGAAAAAASAITTTAAAAASLHHRRLAMPHHRANQTQIKTGKTNLTTPNKPRLR